jgi:hypothetical protein
MSLYHSSSGVYDSSSSHTHKSMGKKYVEKSMRKKSMGKKSTGNVATFEKVRENSTKKKVWEKI